MTPTVVSSSTLSLARSLVPPPPPPGRERPADGLRAIEGSTDTDSFILDVPYRSQYDSSPYQNSNCGPVSLGMVFKAYGLDVPTDQLRSIANHLQGTTAYNDGIALDYLQAIALQAGLRTEGLATSDGHYRLWSMADVIRDVRLGYPVITLVHFATLPQHAGSPSIADHYIVVVGLSGSGFVVNDPASADGSGYRQILSPGQLLAAWQAASIPEQGVAFLPPVGGSGLRPVTFQRALAVAPARANPPAAAPLPSVATVSPRATAAPTATPSSDQAIASSFSEGPASPSWSQRVSAWQRAAPVPTPAPVARPSGASSPPLVLASRSSGNAPLTPTLIVVAVVGLLTLAIVRTPRGSDLD